MESRTGRRPGGNTVSLRMTAAPAQVFAVLGNGWLYPSWVVGASRMREVDDDWPLPRSELHHSFGVWPVLINDTTTVLEWQYERRLVLRARGWPVGEATVVITLEPIHDGCVVSIDEDVAAGPGLAVLAPVRRGLLRVRNREALRRLRFLAEGAAGSEDGRA